MSEAPLPSPLPQLARAESLADRVRRSMREAIVNGALPPGSSHSVSGIARMLGVSPTPVREAIMHLREAGLLATDSNAIVIAVPSRKAVQDAYLLREALECMTARLAAKSRTDEEAESLAELAAESVAAAKAGDAARYRELDTGFHSAISDAARNMALRRATRNARDLAWTLRDLRSLDLDVLIEASQEHVAIADAVLRGDGSDAEAAMGAHISRVAAEALVLFDRAAS